MKKRSIVFLSFVLAFFVTACKSTKEQSDNKNDEQNEIIQSAEENVEASEENEETEMEETKPEQTGTEEIEQTEIITTETSETSGQQTETTQNETIPENSGNGNSNTNNSNESQNNNNTNTNDSGNAHQDFTAYSPQNVVALATAKCQAGGMITTQQNLDNLLATGQITQEEYNEYYPYDGLEVSYYSVFVETNLNIASTVSGQRLTSEDAIADYIAQMLLLESDRVFYISYDGITTTGGTDFYEFRCHR